MLREQPHEFSAMVRLEVSLESQFLTALASYRQDAKVGTQAIAQLVQRIPFNCEDPALLKCLLVCLNSGDPALEKSGSEGVMRLGALASSAVPDLLRIALRDDGEVSNLAASALGVIPGQPSIKAIVEVMHRWHQWDRIFGIALPAFHAHGIDTEPFIDEVDRRLSVVSPDQVGFYSIVLNQLRDAIRVHRTSEYAGAFLPAVADLDEIRSSSDQGLRWSPVAEAMDKPDLFQGEQRFRYTLMNQRSEVGILCERLSRQSDRVMVTILVDERWYGASPRLAPQYLATALTELYDLDPEKTSWVIHQTPLSGYTRKGRDEFWLHTF
jgi:hypothetical protein